MKSVLCKTQRITLYELRDALAMAEGVQVHHSSIAALLKRLGFSYKKIAGGL
ncbi:transposase [Rhodobaca bogoriensis DSM 18756]|nr:transposase [Rhodobaca bogoriensis DSM 18756]